MIYIYITEIVNQSVDGEENLKGIQTFTYTDRHALFLYEKGETRMKIGVDVLNKAKLYLLIHLH